LIDVINSPVYSTAVGLIIYGFRTRELRRDRYNVRRKSFWRFFNEMF
jgi:hypothetical protein